MMNRNRIEQALVARGVSQHEVHAATDQEIATMYRTRIFERGGRSVETASGSTGAVAIGGGAGDYGSGNRAAILATMEHIRGSNLPPEQKDSMLQDAREMLDATPDGPDVQESGAGVTYEGDPDFTPGDFIEYDETGGQ